MAVNPIQVQKYLGGLDYPVSKEDLINTARKNGADNAVLATLRRLPERQYDVPTSVTEEIGSLE